MKKLFHGKESYISLKKAKSVFNELKNNESSVTSITIDCSTSNADSIVGAYKNTDMFSNSKVILLKNLSENKEKEQIKFIEAFNKSAIVDKVIIDVHNGNGGFKTPQEIYLEAFE